MTWKVVLLFYFSFPTFKGLKPKKITNKVLSVQKQVSFAEHKSAKLIYFRVSEKVGWTQGGNRGADSSVLAALCVSYLLKT